MLNNSFVLFFFQDDLHKTLNSTSATDGLSATSFIEYPKYKPFINSDLMRSPGKPVIPYPESNSRGNSPAKLFSCLFPNLLLNTVCLHLQRLQYFILLSLPSNVQVTRFVGPLHLPFWRIPNEKGHVAAEERCSPSEVESCKIGWVLCEIVLTCFLCPFFSPLLCQPFLSWVQEWVWNKETLVPRMVWSKGRGLAMLKWESLQWTKGVARIFMVSVETYRMQKRVQCSAELRAYSITEGRVYSHLFFLVSGPFLLPSFPLWFCCSSPDKQICLACRDTNKTSLG